MAARKPRRPGQPGGDGLDGFAYELLQEKAANIARLGARLERALEALAAFDADRAPGAALTAEDADERERLVAAAGESLWYYVVQREVSGLRDNEAVLRELRVPREVRLRMGVFPRRGG